MTDNSYPGVSMIHFGRMFVFIFFLLIFHTNVVFANPGIPIQIQNGIDNNLKSEFSDNFNEFRDDLWVKLAGYTAKKKQLRNLKPIDPLFTNNSVTFKTKIGNFSKGALNSTFLLSGDFDLQLDCDFDFIPGKSGMDQWVRLGVWDAKNVLIAIHFNKPENSKGYVYSYGTGFKFKGKKSSDKVYLESFKGSLRIVRKGKTAYTYMKPSYADEWEKIGKHKYRNKDVKFGFSIQNFNFKREQIKAKYPLKVTFSNFLINAAGDIVEGDI